MTADAPWGEVPLGKVCEFKYGKSLPEAQRAGGEVPVYGSNGIVGSHNVSITDGATIVIGRKGSFGQVTYSPVDCWPIDTTYYVDQSATNADLKWLAHRLSAMGLTQLNRAAAIPGLNREDAYRLRLLLPPLPEQRRIAAILDHADALRAKRRAAIAQLDTLAQSIFLDMFGDPFTNPHRWPRVGLRECLSMPLRNGLSPSNSGKVVAKVLTLSAVTGHEFDDSAWKEGTFRVAPPPNQSVSPRDLLVCRGNGNIHLVGKGHFPTRPMPDVTFPDTMIAARIATDCIEPTFLQHVWNSATVRAQVESLARTTNGTYKVNQTMLEGISFFEPPLRLQRGFASRLGSVQVLKAAQCESLVHFDALFASLQHRAFRGEL